MPSKWAINYAKQHCEIDFDTDTEPHRSIRTIAETLDRARREAYLHCLTVARQQESPGDIIYTLEQLVEHP